MQWNAVHLGGPFVLGFLLGSIPFGLLLTRAAGLGDIRAGGDGHHFPHRQAEARLHLRGALGRGRGRVPGREVRPAVGGGTPRRCRTRMRV